MKDQLIALLAVSSLAGAAGPALADHNSKNGEGWANMPNDIHNTRIETRENDDNEAFRDFVKYGEGSKTVNRFETEDNSRSSEDEGLAKPRESGVSPKSTARDEPGSRKTSRFDRGVSATSRINRGAMSVRAAGSRRGRGRQ